MPVRVEDQAVVKVDGQQAGQQMDKLEGKVRELNKRLVELRKQPLVDTKKVKAIKKELGKTKAEVNALKKSTFNYNQVLKNLSVVSLRDLQTTPARRRLRLRLSFLISFKLIKSGCPVCYSSLFTNAHLAPWLVSYFNNQTKTVKLLDFLLFTRID